MTEYNTCKTCGKKPLGVGDFVILGIGYCKAHAAKLGQE